MAMSRHPRMSAPPIKEDSSSSNGQGAEAGRPKKTEDIREELLFDPDGIEDAPIFYPTM